MAPAKAPVMAPVLLKYDYWKDESTRILAGDTIDLEVEEAKRLIEMGKAERADPMPGD